ncbi:hypothetical protein ABPG74_010652 [Tetrahymena malaccensis]
MYPQNQMKCQVYQKQKPVIHQNIICTSTNDSVYNCTQPQFEKQSEEDQILFQSIQVQSIYQVQQNLKNQNEQRNENISNIIDSFLSKNPEPNQEYQHQNQEFSFLNDEEIQYENFQEEIDNNRNNCQNHSILYFEIEDDQEEIQDNLIKIESSFQIQKKQSLSDIEISFDGNSMSVDNQEELSLLLTEEQQQKMQNSFEQTQKGNQISYEIEDNGFQITQKMNELQNSFQEDQNQNQKSFNNQPYSIDLEFQNDDFLNDQLFNQSLQVDQSQEYMISDKTPKCPKQKQKIHKFWQFHNSLSNEFTYLIPDLIDIYPKQCIYHKVLQQFQRQQESDNHCQKKRQYQRKSNFDDLYFLIHTFKELDSTEFYDLNYEYAKFMIKYMGQQNNETKENIKNFKNQIKENEKLKEIFILNKYLRTETFGLYFRNNYNRVVRAINEINTTNRSRIKYFCKFKYIDKMMEFKSNINTKINKTKNANTNKPPNINSNENYQIEQIFANDFILGLVENPDLL